MIYVWNFNIMLYASDQCNDNNDDFLVHWVFQKCRLESYLESLNI